MSSMEGEKQRFSAFCYSSTSNFPAKGNESEGQSVKAGEKLKGMDVYGGKTKSVEGAKAAERTEEAVISHGIPWWAQGLDSRRNGS